MAKKTKRVSVPKSIETKLLIKSGRRCPLCVYLKNDFDIKNLQIAHIDNDPSNNDLDNLIFKLHKRLGKIMADVEFAEEGDNIEPLKSEIEVLSQKVRSKLFD
jgi:glycosidase